MSTKAVLCLKILAFIPIVLILTFKAIETMKIKISALIGMNDCVLSVYYCNDGMYRFSVVNAMGKIYTCDDIFATLSSAKYRGISVTEKLAIDR